MTFIPPWSYLPSTVSTAERVQLERGEARFCPVCEKVLPKFGPFGLKPRQDAQCSNCGALERHRLSWLYLLSKTDLFDGRPKIMLHFAPESCFEPLFRSRLGDSYFTADLEQKNVSVNMDITNIRSGDGAFDVIYCCHVLEHIVDDRRAMRELCRVMHPNGWGIILVPITRPQTYEDPTITDPLERLKAFGQRDHVRHYGPDYIDRLRESGFTVAVTRTSELVSNAEAVAMGLTSASGDIYLCTKAKKSLSE